MTVTPRVVLTLLVPALAGCALLARPSVAALLARPTAASFPIRLSVASFPARPAQRVEAASPLTPRCQAHDRTTPRTATPGTAPSTTLSPTQGAPEQGAPEGRDETAVDLYGNAVSSAVATYQIDATGSLYELHSPQTEVPQLKPPKG